MNNTCDNSDDGLIEGVHEWKAKYEALLKVNKELEEQKSKSVAELEEKSKSLEQLLQKHKLCEKMSDNLEERVRCPVCLEVPTSGPFYSCTKGHLVCTSCYQGPTSNCPLCRTRMFKTFSLLATTVIENIEHRCKFEAEGCKEKMLVGKVEEHRLSCNFRPVSCPSIGCKVRLPLTQLVDHITGTCNHSYAKIQGKVHDLALPSCTKTFTFSFDPKPPVICTYTFKWRSQFFFLIEMEDGPMHRKFYVQMLGSEEECKKYRVGISMEDAKGLNHMKFCDNPLSIEMSEENLKYGGMQISNKMKERLFSTSVVDPQMHQFTVTLLFAEALSI